MAITSEQLVLVVEARVAAAEAAIKTLQSEAEAATDPVYKLLIEANIADAQVGLSQLKEQEDQLRASAEQGINLHFTGTSPEQISQGLGRAEQGLGQVSSAAQRTGGSVQSASASFSQLSGALGPVGGDIQNVLQALGALQGSLAQAAGLGGGLGAVFAQMATPVGATIAVMAALGAVLSSNKDEMAQQEEALKHLSAGYGDLAQSASDYTTAVADAKDEGLTGFFHGLSDSLVDVARDAANAAGVIDQTGTEMRQTSDSVEAFNKSLEDGGVVAARFFLDQLPSTFPKLDELRGKLTEQTNLQVQLAVTQDKWNEELAARVKLEEAGIDTSNLSTAAVLAKSEAMDAAIQAEKDQKKAEEDAKKATEDAAKAAEDAAQAWLGWDEAISSLDFRTADVAGAVKGLEGFRSKQLALLDIAVSTADAYDNFSEALKKNGNTFDFNTAKGRDNIKALEAVNKIVDLQLVAAYDKANGSQEAFMKNAQEIALVTLSKLGAAGNLTNQQLQELAKTLGLTPKDLEIRFKMSGIEEARTRLDLLSGAIADLPDDKKTRVEQQIIAGDFVGALATVNDYYKGHPAAVGTTVNPPPAAGPGSAAAAVGGFKPDPLLVGVEFIPPTDPLLVGVPFIPPQEAKITVIPPDTAPTVAAVQKAAAGPYNAKIHVDPDFPSLSDTSASIIAVAHALYEAVINVSANTGAAESAINALTRPRTVPVSVIVNAPGFDSAVASAVQRWMSRNGALHP